MKGVTKALVSKVLHSCIRSWASKVHAMRVEVQKQHNSLRTSAIIRVIATRMVELSVNHNLDMNLISSLMSAFRGDKTMSAAITEAMNHSGSLVTPTNS